MDEDTSQTSQNSLDPRLVIDEDKSSQGESAKHAEGLSVEKQTGEPENEDKNLTPDEVALTNLENKLKEFHTIASASKNESDSPGITRIQSKVVKVVKIAPSSPVSGNEPGDSNEPFAVPGVVKTAPKPLTPCQEKQVALAWNAAGVHRCPVCKFSTDDTAIFENHRTSCMPPRLPADAEGPVLLSYKHLLYKCVTCMITWKNRAEFEEHIVCHLLSDPYLCITCMKTFRSRVAIEQHAKQIHVKGESRCGLKGMKKGRRIVDNLEANGSYEFRGRLTIPKTPRNQIKTGETSATTTTESNEQAKLDHIPKNTNTGIQGFPVVTAVNVTKPATEQRNGGTDKGIPATSINTSSSVSVTSTNMKNNGTVTVPSSVAATLSTNVSYSTSVQNQPPLTTAQVAIKSSVEKTVKAPKEKPPQYHVKHFTEYTKEQTVSQSSPTQVISGQSTAMLLLPVGGPTPVGPILQVDPVTKLLVPLQYQQTPPDQANWPVRTVQSTATVSSFVAQTPRTSIIVPEIQSKTVSVPSTHSREQTKFQYIAPKYQNFPRPQVTPVVMPNGNISPQSPAVCRPSEVKNNIQFPQPSVQSTFSTFQTVATSEPQSSLQTGMQNAFNVQPQSLPATSHQAPSVTPATATMNIPTNSGLTLPIQQNTNSTPTIMNPFVSVAQGSPNTGIQNIPAMAEQSKMAVFKEKFNIPPASTAMVTKQNDPIVTTLQTKINKDPPTYNEAVKVLETRDDQCVAAVHVPSASNTSNAKKFLFRIKPGQGFVCEACRKFTKDEIVFRRHVWDHFHQQPLACKTCHATKILNKDVLGCLLVNDVVLSLIKMSDVSGTGSNVSGDHVKAVTIVDDVISISDDEGEAEGIHLQGSKHREQPSATVETKATDPDVIVLEDDVSTNTGDNGNDLNIKIASSYSLSGQSSNEPSKKNHVSTSDEEKRKTENVKEMNEEKASAFPSRVLEKKKDNFVVSCPANEKLSDNLSDLLESTTSNVAALNEIGLENKIADTDDNTCPTNELFADRKTSFEQKKLGTVQKQKAGFGETEKGVPFTIPGHGVDNTTVHSKVAKVDNSQERLKFESDVLENQRLDAFYICGMDNCVYACLTSQKYREHLASKHAGAYNLVCCHCGVKDYNDDAHVRHMYSHANAKVFLLYNCPVRLCKYKTNLVHMYGEHLKCHKPEDLNIKCVFCHQVFTDITALVSHLKDNLLKFVNCPHCSFKFVNKAVVMKHIQLSHPDKPRMVSVTSQVVCLEREINFYSPPAAKLGVCAPITEQDIPDSAKIDIPGMLDRVDKETDSFPQDKQTTEELNKVKNSHKIDKELRVILDRNSVLNAKDSDALNLKCPHCTYLSYNQRFYREHTAMHIDDEEPDRSKRFICMYCPKATNNVNEFKTHMSNHIGTHELKLFTCTLCSYQSNQKYNIMDHIQDGHSEKGQYVLVTTKVKSNEETCKYCKTFKSRVADHVYQHENKCSFQTVKDKSAIIQSVAKSPQLPNSPADKNWSATSSSHTVPSTQLSDQEGEKTTLNEESDNKKGRKYHCHYCTQYFKHKSDLRTHLQDDHLDMQDKNFSTFKCKYCHYTSTMKEVIVSHMNKKHEGQEVRILRRIETVESAVTQIYQRSNTDDIQSGQRIMKNQYQTMKTNEKETTKSGSETDGKEEIVIPDGNIFSQPFKCTKCSFTHKMRLSVMRHIKEHPELYPVREATKLNVSKKATARKSTSASHEQTHLTFPHQNALQQKASRVENPFTTVKKIVSNMDKTGAAMDQKGKSVDNPFMAVKKIVSSLDKTEVKTDKHTSSDHYVLGGDELHGRLSACFLPLEKELGFRCRICQQKIAKKFVLHRHVLDHLKIVFYKCWYCEQGAIEQTLLLGHIHNEHPLKPVQFDTIEKTEIITQMRDKIASQNFNDTLNLLEQSDRHDVDYAEKTGIVKKSVHEPSKNEPKAIDDTPGIYKCHLCKYTVKINYFLKLHLKGHEDPNKIFSCSVCGYLSASQYDVTRHIQKVHSSNGTVINNANKDIKIKSDTEKKDHIDRSRERRSASVDSKSSKRSISSSLGDTTEGESKPKRSKATPKFFYEMRQLYKCIDCGEKKHSKGAIYDHFKGSKCARTWYQCVYCNFLSSTKTNIKSHIRIRHAGKKIDVKCLPMSAKIKDIKIPIKTPVVYSENGSDKDSNDQASKVQVSLSSAPSTTVEVYKCQVCNKYTSESMMKLQFHFNTKHEGKQVQCQQCVYRTPLIKHMINHCKNLHMQDTAKYSLVADVAKAKLNSKKDGKSSTPTLISSGDEDDDDATVGYECTKCEYVGRSPSILKMHMKTHLNYRPYCCKYCDLQFKLLKYIKSHIEKIHSGKIIKYSVQKDDVMESRLERMAEQARKGRERKLKATSKKSESSPKKGAMADSDDEPPIKKVRKTPHKSSTKAEKRGYREAVDWAGRPLFQCLQCDFKSNKKFSLQCHMGKKHGSSDVNIFKCWYCDYASSFLCNTYRHVKMLHPGRALRVINNKTSQILSPSKTAASSPTKTKKSTADIKPPPKLDYERGTSNPSERVSVSSDTFMKETATQLSYSCNLCDAEVMGVYNFRQHLTSHDGFKYVEKLKRTQSRLACGYCFYVAKDNTDFSEHISSHLDGRRYKCGYCDYTSFQMASIIKHQSSRHPDEPVKVVDTHQDQAQGYVFLVNIDPVINLERCDDKSFNIDKKEIADEQKSTIETNDVIAMKEPGNIPQAEDVHDSLSITNDKNEELQRPQSDTDMECNDVESTDLHASGENNSETGFSINNDRVDMVKQLIGEQPDSDSKVAEHIETTDEHMDEETQEGIDGDRTEVEPAVDHRTTDIMPNIEETTEVGSENESLAKLKDTTDSKQGVRPADMKIDSANVTPKEYNLTGDGTNMEIDYDKQFENSTENHADTDNFDNLNSNTDSNNLDLPTDKDADMSNAKVQNDNLIEDSSNIEGSSNDNHLEQSALESSVKHSGKNTAVESKLCEERNQIGVDESQIADKHTANESSEDIKCGDSEPGIEHNERVANSPIKCDGSEPGMQDNELVAKSHISETNSNAETEVDEHVAQESMNKNDTQCVSSHIDEETNDSDDTQLSSISNVVKSDNVDKEVGTNHKSSVMYDRRVNEKETDVGDCNLDGKQSDMSIEDITICKHLNIVSRTNVESCSDESEKQFDVDMKENYINSGNGESGSTEKVTQLSDVNVSDNKQESNVNSTEDCFSENVTVEDSIVNNNSTLTSEEKEKYSTGDQLCVPLSETFNVTDIGDSLSKANSDIHNTSTKDNVEKENISHSELVEDTPTDMQECSSTSDVESHAERNIFNDMQIVVSPKSEVDQHENVEIEASKEVTDKGRNVFEDLTVNNLPECKSDSDTSFNFETSVVHTNMTLGMESKGHDQEMKENNFAHAESSECSEHQADENTTAKLESLQEERNVFEILGSTDSSKNELDISPAEDMSGVQDAHGDRNVFKAVCSDLGDNIDEHSEDMEISMSPLKVNKTEENNHGCGSDSNPVEQPKDDIEKERNIFDDINVVTVKPDSVTVRNLHVHDNITENNLVEIKDSFDKGETDNERNIGMPSVDQVTTDNEDSAGNGNRSMSVEDIISDINSSLQEAVPSPSDHVVHTQAFMSSTQPFDMEDSDTNVDMDES